jgi:hypothetical protein
MMRPKVDVDAKENPPLLKPLWCVRLPLLAKEARSGHPALVGRSTKTSIKLTARSKAAGRSARSTPGEFAGCDAASIFCFHRFSFLNVQLTLAIVPKWAYWKWGGVQNEEDGHKGSRLGMAVKPWSMWRKHESGKCSTMSARQSEWHAMWVSGAAAQAALLFS